MNKKAASKNIVNIANLSKIGIHFYEDNKLFLLHQIYSKSLQCSSAINSQVEYERIGRDVW